jgi:SAM-dependent methyltransferase
LTWRPDSGNAAIAAAAAGATVVAADLTLELFIAGRQRAGELHVDIDWREADAEAMPFADAEFDTVLSCLGVMFAPHHRAAADELLRVCRRGGTIGLISWTPAGFVGQMFATMSRSSRRRLREHSRRRCGAIRITSGSCSAIESTRSRLAPRRSPCTGSTPAPRSAITSRRYYGPTVAAYRGLADAPQRAAALDRELAALGEQHFAAGVMQWEYLLVTATRR